MFHELPLQFLYSAYKLEAEHRDDIGTIKNVIASAFILEIAPGMPWIITNRHVIDLNYGQSHNHKNFTLTKLKLTGRRGNDSIYTCNIELGARVFCHENEENDVVLIQALTCNDPDGPKTWYWHFSKKMLADKDAYKDIHPFDLICYSGFPDQYDKLGERPILRVPTLGIASHMDSASHMKAFLSLAPQAVLFMHQHALHMEIKIHALNI